MDVSKRMFPQTIHHLISHIDLTYAWLVIASFDYHVHHLWRPHPLNYRWKMNAMLVYRHKGLWSACYIMLYAWLPGSLARRGRRKCHHIMDSLALKSKSIHISQPTMYMYVQYITHACKRSSLYLPRPCQGPFWVRISILIVSYASTIPLDVGLVDAVFNQTL